MLDTRLSDNQWLAGDYSIADIANWCWVRTHKWSGISVDGLDHLNRWSEAIDAQPGMTKGIEVPFSLGNLLEDEEEAKKFTDKAGMLVQK